MTVPVRINPNDARLQREYVAGGGFSWYGYRNDKIVLPWGLDDIVSEQAWQIYDKMILDGQVSACITVFKASIIEEGLQFSSPITDEHQDGFDKAKTIADEANKMFARMSTDVDNFLWNMLDATIYGSKVAENIYTLVNNKLYIEALKVKPRTSVAFVVDEYFNVVGILADTNGLGVLGTFPVEGNYLPRYKFSILSWRMKDEDPRGTSMLRPAYEGWWRKRMMMPEYLKYLSQFAGPSIIGYTAEGASIDETDPDSETPFASPEEAMLSALMKFRNASAAAFPYGSQVDILDQKGDGQAFLSAFAMSNLEITKAILTQQLATEESQFMARAAAQVHQDVLDTLVRQGKRSVIRMITKDIIHPWIAYNWGEKAVDLAPIVSLGTVESRDLAPVMNAIAALRRANYFSDDQFGAIDTLLGFPQRKEPPPPLAVASQKPADSQGNNQTNTPQPADNADNNTDQPSEGN